MGVVSTPVMSISPPLVKHHHCWIDSSAVSPSTADESIQQWWCFTKGGEMLMTGVDTTPIADGEHYEITFTVGW